MRRCALALGLVAAAAAPGAVAWAAFGSGVSANASFATYTVAVPGNLRCTGLLQLSTSRIVWDAVPPPAGQTVDYVVTPPDGRSTTTSATFHQLPAITLVPGRYAVQARISSGWLSQPATITVTLGALGLLYLCSAP
jgi:hypothetical protein